MMGETDLPGTEDLNKTTADSVSMDALWASTVAAGEIIVPGYRLPTFDAKHHPTLTAKRLCAFRRGVLAEATKDAKSAEIVRRFVGDSGIPAKMPCDAVKIAFNATADAIRVERNGGAVVRSTTGDAARGGDAAKVPSLSEMNANAAKFWHSKAGTGNGAVRH
jgi:hypothetical protein